MNEVCSLPTNDKRLRIGKETPNREVPPIKDERLNQEMTGADSEIARYAKR